MNLRNINFFQYCPQVLCPNKYWFVATILKYLNDNVLIIRLRLEHLFWNPYIFHIKVFIQYNLHNLLYHFMLVINTLDASSLKNFLLSLKTGRFKSIIIRLNQSRQKKLEKSFQKVMQMFLLFQSVTEERKELSSLK